MILHSVRHTTSHEIAYVNGLGLWTGKNRSFATRRPSLLQGYMKIGDARSVSGNWGEVEWPVVRAHAEQELQSGARARRVL